MLHWLLAAALVTAAAQDSVAARLDRVESALAIERILIDYAGFLDDRDYDGYVGLFAPDGEWINPGGSYKGRAAIRKMLETTVGPAGLASSSVYHIITNPRIDIDGDRATAVSRFLVMLRGPGGAPVPSLAGIYRDDLVRIDGTWKIRRRLAENVMPTPEEWAKIMAERRARQ